METRRLFTCRLDSIRFVSSVGEDRLIAASPDKLIWYRVQESGVEELQHSRLEGRSFSLLPLCDHTQAVLQFELSPMRHSLQVVGKDGLKERAISIPFHRIYQVTTDSSVSHLALYGLVSASGKAGYIDSVESCLIELQSGDLQRLPCSAVAIAGDALYLVKDRTVYRKKLAFRRSSNASDDAFSGDPLDVMASDKVLLVAPKDDSVWLATERGLFAANSLDVALVHAWDCVSRVRVCGDVFFAAGIGPELQVYDTRNRVASCITSSSRTQITGFDALCLSRENDAAEGLLMLVSEKGVLDYFRWSSSSGH